LRLGFEEGKLRFFLMKFDVLVGEFLTGDNLIYKCFELKFVDIRV